MIHLYLNVYTNQFFVAQIQLTILKLLFNKTIELSEELRIHANHKSIEIFEIAFTDLFNIIENLSILSNSNFVIPKVVYTTNKKDADLSIGISKLGDSNEEYDYVITYIDMPQVDITSKVITTSKVTYKAIGKFENDGSFKVENKKNDAINYFLQNIFRKNEFREGQLPIINKALQGEDVIGILPTGSGKSLTYQICTLLQPGIAIVNRPH